MVESFARTLVSGSNYQTHEFFGIRPHQKTNRFHLAKGSQVFVSDLILRSTDEHLYDEQFGNLRGSTTQMSLCQHKRMQQCIFGSAWTYV